jgi:hypothetical protein
VGAHKIARRSLGPRSTKPHEAKKTGTPSGEVREAVKKAGNSRGKVETELKK